MHAMRARAGTPEPVLHALRRTGRDVNRLDCPDPGVQSRRERALNNHLVADAGIAS
jgi:hypothetical protein